MLLMMVRVVLVVVEVAFCVVAIGAVVVVGGDGGCGFGGVGVDFAAGSGVDAWPWFVAVEHASQPASTMASATEFGEMNRG